KIPRSLGVATSAWMVPFALVRTNKNMVFEFWHSVYFKNTVRRLKASHCRSVNLEIVFFVNLLQVFHLFENVLLHRRVVEEKCRTRIRCQRGFQLTKHLAQNIVRKWIEKIQE